MVFRGVSRCQLHVSPPQLLRLKVGEFDLATGCVVNRDPRVLIHGRDILKIVSGVPGFEARVKYLSKRVQDLNSQIFPLVNK